MRPNEIYNLGAQSHVGVSFETPLYTAEVSGLGSLRILEIIRFLKLKTKFYQATTSELFGKKDKGQSLMKNLNLTQNLHTVCPNYFLILLQKFTESLTAFTQQVEFCLIMKVQEEAKLLLQEKLQCF